MDDRDRRLDRIPALCTSRNPRARHSRCSRIPIDINRRVPRNRGDLSTLRSARQGKPRPASCSSSVPMKSVNSRGNERAYNPTRIALSEAVRATCRLIGPKRGVGATVLGNDRSIRGARGRRSCAPLRRKIDIGVSTDKRETRVGDRGSGGGGCDSSRLPP